MRLKDKIAIVTGGTTGIGYATAKLFLEEGATVNLFSLGKELLEQTVNDLKSLGQVRAYEVDISNKNQVQQAVEQVIEEFGRIDILVNNAGITSDAQFYKMTDEQWDKVIDINLKGTYLMSKAVVPFMQDKKYGKIINATSVSAYNGNFGQANYAASKAGIIGMTRVMGKELGKFGINVNAVAPGAIMTDMYKAVPDHIKEKKLSVIPLRRYGVPEDAALLYLFLASDESSYITSQTITIDGGFN